MNDAWNQVRVRAASAEDGAMDDASNQVRVRAARICDDAALASLDAVAWTAESGIPSVLARPAAAFFSDGAGAEEYLVAELAGRLVGYVAIKPVTHLAENAHVLGIAGIAVAPDVRRAGVGAALLTAAEELARARGARKLSLRVLGTNPAAQRLYQRLGFEIEGILRDEFAINGRYVDDVLMAKPLRGHT